ncbi:MAG: hypothetical protein L0Y72_02845 [Gemmataceae bacterium]|nr:hypothetical protein [Gemmataceae bacterium]MCI0737955.1 hypothetical protein [Gemmataceae bacterium]
METLTPFSRMVLVIGLACGLVLTTQGQEAKSTNKPLKGKTKTIENARFTAVGVPAKDMLPCMLWGDKAGGTLYTLERSGVVRKILVPGFTEARSLDIESKCDWLTLSNQGLAVTVSGKQEVWLLDPDTLEVKKKMPAATIKQAVSAPNLNVAYVTNGTQLAILDLAKGKLGAAIKGEYENLAVTPNGGYLLAASDKIFRYKIAKSGAIKPEEAGPAIAEGRRGSGLMLSPDGELVCLPTGGGNRTGLPLHPPAKSYSTFIYPVKNLKKPDCVIEQGGYPEVVGFDPAAKLIYAQGGDFALMVFNYGGIKKKEYRSNDVRGVRQYLPHPDGRKLLLLAESQLSWIELSKE